jgi:ABC-type phosphate transport system auxiliary subunit
MTPADLLRAAIEASGLSARRFAVEVLKRDERTVRRWLAGDSPIPKAVMDYLTRSGVKLT